jgi:DNA (cytosine-5)-methyltransferase 1
MRPIVLDLFCGTGGAARGYQRAGFDTIGVDILPRNHYPGQLIEADALVLLDMLNNGAAVDGVSLADIALIHASPPCQRYSGLTVVRGTNLNFPDLIQPTLDLMAVSGKPYVVENVERAPMPDKSITLCGTQFGQPYLWHRKFYCSFPVSQPQCCHGQHYASPENGPARQRIRDVYGPKPENQYHAVWRGVNWTKDKTERRNALPPVYTEYIGLFAQREIRP